jgi:hypothetical protein
MSAQDYHAWMEAQSYGSGQCAEATAAMVSAFPQLRRVRGHVTLLESPKPVPHWWCENESGDIYDPTEHQFLAIVDYLPHHGEEPVGKCIECGGYIYPSGGYTSAVCSDACARAAEAAMMGRAR